MRSFFNRPSWASRGDSDGDAEFYRRADQIYKDIVDTHKSARGRRTSSFESSSHKRRRVSSASKDGSAEGSMNGQKSVSDCIKSASNSPSCSDGTPPDTSRNNLSMAEPIAFSDGTPPSNAKEPISPIPRASPRNEPQGLQTDFTLSNTEMINNEITDTLATHPSPGQRIPTEPGRTPTNGKSVHDHSVVQILITSKIENTKPLIVHRKMHQSLKGVRLAWCAHQDLPKASYSSVFLTWKGRRLFDVTTCRSLNIDVHNTITKGLSPFGDVFNDIDGIRIHMEAVTEEVSTAATRCCANVMVSLAATESEKAEQLIQGQLVLKSPGLEDFKIHFTPETRISQVVAAFREARNLSKELNVYLAFDGDRLSPHSCLADYEITDGDLIDVLVKKAM